MGRIISETRRIGVHPCAFLAEPFEDETHPRLRFPHRGLIACANNGTKNSNDSQFFITLGSCAQPPRFLFLLTLSKTGQKNYMGNIRCSEDASAILSTVRPHPRLLEASFKTPTIDVVKIGAMGE